MLSVGLGLCCSGSPYDTVEGTEARDSVGEGGAGEVGSGEGGDWGAVVGDGSMLLSGFWAGWMMSSSLSLKGVKSSLSHIVLGP